MEELFENKTKYTEKEYNIFLNSYQQEYAVSETLYTIFDITFLIFATILLLINREFLLSGIVFISLLAFSWYKFIRPKKVINKEKNSNKIQQKFVNTYKFYSHNFSVQNQEGKANIFYIKIYRVVETKSYFYIYMSRENAYILSKRGFTKGNINDFKKFLRKKSLFYKYKNRIKREEKTK